MASLFPFRALRYDPDRARLADVVTQPYDKITPAMQERYYAASPYNLVRLELGKRETEGDVYPAAARHLADWRKAGILRQDERPSFYAYSQRFRVPGSEQHFERRGVIAAVKLEDYDRGVIFRHEQTLSGPKADRLNLLRATRTSFGQLFMLYSDPAQAVERLLFPASGQQPEAEVTDEYGVVHRLWVVNDPKAIAQAQALMAEKQLIIADGHHRYETALTYRNERRAAAGSAGENAGYERAMMTLVNVDAEGLVVLPTHRVVHGLAMFDPEQLLRGAKRYFDVEPLPAELDAAAAMKALAPADGEMRFLAFCGQRNFLFRARPEALAALLPDVSPRQRALDVVVLHRVLLQKVLGISEAAIREQRNLAYVREAGEAIARVREGRADAAFLMNPVRIEQMREVALAGEVMPQKSTDFYPKLLSGLAGYAME
ncbi:MAG: DUF1015 domain-containing protein [Candidatus Koribacter versatilis]|uniref:DUF1015 domain-containing protein n=1 Tax=Candidatus Korobacter versatilis TaxID=658062 RepID=A0A932A829_9BACT|nr:DUF1015 domain-containing protein [Candidatus Koribacter versatilis]